MTSTRRLLAASLALATAITLASCSSDASSGMSGMDHGSTSASSSSAETEEFNDQDVAFAQMMTPHHEQAVEMAGTILAKEGVGSDVTDLATQITQAQEPEIEQLEGFLAAWGAGDSMAGMDHGMSGMMSDDDLAALESATGTDAERLFLEQMTVHHEGAVEMAQAEIDEGLNPDAIELATTIVATQTEELSTLQELLAAR